MQDALVRSAAASALLALYGQRDNVAPLHDFTERFLQVQALHTCCVCSDVRVPWVTWPTCDHPSLLPYAALQRADV